MRPLLLVLAFTSLAHAQGIPLPIVNACDGNAGAGGTYAVVYVTSAPQPDGSHVITGAFTDCKTFDDPVPAVLGDGVRCGCENHPNPPVGDGLVKNCWASLRILTDSQTEVWCQSAGDVTETALQRSPTGKKLTRWYAKRALTAPIARSSSSLRGRVHATAFGRARLVNP